MSSIRCTRSSGCSCSSSVKPSLKSKVQLSSTLSPHPKPPVSFPQTPTSSFSPTTCSGWCLCTHAPLFSNFAGSQALYGIRMRHHHNFWDRHFSHRLASQPPPSQSPLPVTHWPLRALTQMLRPYCILNSLSNGLSNLLLPLVNHLLFLLGLLIVAALKVSSYISLQPSTLLFRSPSHGTRCRLLRKRPRSCWGQRFAS